MSKWEESDYEALDKTTVYMAGDFSYPSKMPYIPIGPYGYIALDSVDGSDASVARDARVQPEADWRPDFGDGKMNDPRLLRHLFMSNPCHSTPFEKTFIKFWVKAPIFVYREWHRHRVWSFNEESARYKQLPPHYWMPKLGEIGVQSEKNHQSRVIDYEFSKERDTEILKEIERAYRAADFSYRNLISLGTPREVARCVMPVGIYSEMVASVSLWNLFKFMDLRWHPDAQQEIREYAEAMFQLLMGSDKFPIIMKLYEEKRNSR